MGENENRFTDEEIEWKKRFVESLDDDTIITGPAPTMEIWHYTVIEMIRTIKRESNERTKQAHNAG